MSFSFFSSMINYILSSGKLNKLIAVKLLKLFNFGNCAFSGRSYLQEGTQNWEYFWPLKCTPTFVGEGSVKLCYFSFTIHIIAGMLLYKSHFSINSLTTKWSYHIETFNWFAMQINRLVSEWWEYYSLKIDKIPRENDSFTCVTAFYSKKL